jgi:hypothetical protein
VAVSGYQPNGYQGPYQGAESGGQYPRGGHDDGYAQPNRGYGPPAGYGQDAGYDDGYYPQQGYPSDPGYGQDPGYQQGYQRRGIFTEEPVRRKHRLRNWSIALGILLALFIAVDRVGVVITEGLLADKLQSSQNLTSKPSVSIGGFPFLTQLAGMDFDNVSVSADEIKRNGLVVTKLTAHLHGVKPQSGFSSAHVNQLNGTAFVNFADLNVDLQDNVPVIKGYDLAVRSDGQGGLQATVQRIPVPVSVQMSVDPATNSLVLKLTAPGGIPLPAAVSTFKLPMTALPFNLRLTGVTVSDTGVSIDASSSNVTLDSNSLGTG